MSCGNLLSSEECGPGCHRFFRAIEQADGLPFCFGYPPLCAPRVLVITPRIRSLRSSVCNALARPFGRILGKRDDVDIAYFICPGIIQPRHDVTVARSASQIPLPGGLPEIPPLLDREIEWDTPIFGAFFVISVWPCPAANSDLSIFSKRAAVLGKISGITCSGARRHRGSFLYRLATFRADNAALDEDLPYAFPCDSRLSAYGLKCQAGLIKANNFIVGQGAGFFHAVSLER